MKHRNSYVISKPEPVGRSGTNVGDCSVFRPRGIRCLGGVSLDQALLWNAGTCRFDVKEEVQVGKPCKNESTDANHRGGTTRSSDEISVMEMERRGRVVRYCLKNQLLKAGGVH